MKKLLWVLLLVGIVALSVVGCDYNSNAAKQRNESITQRAQMFALAEALFPLPLTKNFVARQMLVKFTEREDIINHPYYVYVYSDVGTVIGYYVAQSFPISTNAFLSSTEEVYGGESKVVLTAPSLDGIYYGGSGAASGDGWFFFDAATDALIILYDWKIFVSDYPLLLDAPRIMVENTSDNSSGN